MPDVVISPMPGETLESAPIPVPITSEPVFAFSEDDLDGLSFEVLDEKPDAATFAPGTLVERDGGTWSVVYSTFPQSTDLQKIYDERGLPGGGSTWQGFVAHLMKKHAPDALAAVEFERGGSAFCAISADLGALRAVGAALAQLEDIELVKQLAATVDVPQYD
jgi:hypothetical protein